MSRHGYFPQGSSHMARVSPRSKFQRARMVVTDRKSQKPANLPVIVIPITNPVPGINSPNIIHLSTVRAQNKEFPVNQPLHPLTPHAHVVSDLPPLIHRAMRYMDYDLEVIPDNFSETEPSTKAQKKTDTLSSILRIVSDPLSRHSLSADVYEQLMNMVCLHIFRNDSPYVRDSEFSEFTTKYRIKNWPHINITHKILHAMMCDHSQFSRLIGYDFVSQLVRHLDTPVQAERQHFEETLKMIIEGYIGQRQSVLHCMLSMLFNYREKYVRSTPIPPIIRLFISYFSTLTPPLKHFHFLIFRTVIYPLFATDSANEFDGPLNDLSLMFQLSDPATSFWCLKFLDNHWPKTSVQKELAFLRQLTTLMPTLPSTLLPGAAPIIARRLSGAIASESTAVALFAIMFCDNDDFLGVFRGMPNVVARYLTPAARAATGMWKAEIGEYASQLLKKLSAIERAAKGSPAMPLTDNSRQKWLAVARKAQGAGEDVGEALASINAEF